MLDGVKVSASKFHWRRHTPRRRPHESTAFRSFDPVNGLRPPEAAREGRHC